MKTAACVLTLFAVCLFIAADDTEQSDLAKLQGDWQMVSGEANGLKLPISQVKTGKRSCKDNEVTIMMNGALFLKAKIKLEPSKNPKYIDYNILEGANAGKSQMGIYHVDGDTVKFCFARPGMARPSDFTTTQNSGRTLSEWTRIADEEKK